LRPHYVDGTNMALGNQTREDCESLLKNQRMPAYSPARWQKTFVTDWGKAKYTERV